jgi:hypothetical protein
MNFSIGKFFLKKQQKAYQLIFKDWLIHGS